MCNPGRKIYVWSSRIWFRFMTVLSFLCKNWEAKKKSSKQRRRKCARKKREVFNWIVGSEMKRDSRHIKNKLCALFNHRSELTRKQEPLISSRYVSWAAWLIMSHAKLLWCEVDWKVAIVSTRVYQNILMEAIIESRIDYFYFLNSPPNIIFWGNH